MKNNTKNEKLKATLCLMFSLISVIVMILYIIYFKNNIDTDGINDILISIIISCFEETKEKIDINWLRQSILQVFYAFSPFISLLIAIISYYCSKKFEDYARCQLAGVMSCGIIVIFILLSLFNAFI